jgi:aminoglycoside phosphotransferase (APT) family kinase protein
VSRDNATVSGLSTPAFPPASGRRMQWDEMPAPVRSAIEDRLGSRVVSARSQAGGFSPGVAARLRLADGARVFVKAVCGSSNPDSPAIHRREARVAAALPAGVPAPALRWSWDDGEWVVLAFDDVDGRAPELPWRAGELKRVLDALYGLATLLTPSPIALEPAGESLARLFGRWHRIADPSDGSRPDGNEPDGSRPDGNEPDGNEPDGNEKADEGRLPIGIRNRLDELVELESRWPDAVRGDTLVHLDVRADNLLLTPDRVLVVDWPWAAVGAPWLDLVAMLPSVAMQGGPAPDDVWRAHPLNRGVDADRVDAFIAALAGLFVHDSLLPPPPGIPTLRAFPGRSGRARDRVARAPTRLARPRDRLTGRRQTSGVKRQTSDEVGVGDDLDEGRAGVRECTCQRVVELLALCHPRAVRAAEPCVGREVGVVQGGLPYVRLRGSLRFRDLAELAVVEQNVGDVHAVPHRGGDLGEVLAEPAVAGDRDDRAVGAAAHAPVATGKPKPIEPR